MENDIVSGAASTDVAASYNDEDFSAGLAEAFGFEREEPAGAAESGEESEGSEEIPEGQTKTEETETEPEPTEGGEEKAAESGAESTTAPKMLFFKEHGKEFGVPEEAVEAFAKGVGRDSASIIDIYQKGCNYDALLRRFNEANEFSEAFEKIAGFQNRTKEEVKAELLEMIERIPVDRMTAEIQKANPGMTEAVARELAEHRIGLSKPKAEEKPKEEDDSEETAAKLREIDIFQANHPELPKLPNEIIELWKRTGFSLEEAYEGFRTREENEALKKELEELRKEKTKTAQKEYSREHSPGSANSAFGNVKVDPFIEGLFAEY